MTDYPRRQQPEGPPKPTTQASGPSAYDEPEEKRKPTVRVQVRSGKPGPYGSERLEEVEMDYDVAQDWDERGYSSGGAYGSGDPYQRW